MLLNIDTGLHYKEGICSTFPFRKITSTTLEQGQKFRVDRWTREEGGGGVTCIIQDGHVFEKAGVGVSVVHGLIPASAVAQMNARGKQLPEGQEMPFFACGISSVIHPRYF